MPKLRSDYGASVSLLNETRRQTCIAFAEKAEIHRKGIGRLKHPRSRPVRAA